MSLVWSPDYAPVDADFADVSLLLLGEGTNGSTTVLDSSSNNLSVTAVGNAQISTAVNTPFGTGDGVLAFDGSGDALVTNTVSSLQMEGFNFTWECWLYLVALPSPGNFMSFWAQRTGNPQFGGPIIAIINTGAIQFYISNANASAFILSGVSTGLSVTLNQWNHYALVRNGSSLTLYKNGTAGSVVTLSTDVGFSDNTTIGAGAADYIQSINGYLSNIRITKGVARYTENFDVPTAPFPILSPSGRITIADDSLDADARQYIINVEEQDGQALEPGVRTAINDFVVGCKSDGIWNAIKASCLLSGARTLEGALVPLKGGAPTNFNFTSSDYDRKTGLVGDGSSKYLDSNRNNNADPRNSFHLSVYASSVGTTGYGIGAGAIDAGTSMLGLGFSVQRSRTGNVFSNVNTAAGFNGHSRSLSNQYTHRTNASNTTLQTTSEAQANLTLFVFARGVVGAPAALSDARIAFYSIGEALPDSPTQTGLELLDTRVTDLITAIGAAIP